MTTAEKRAAALRALFEEEQCACSWTPTLQAALVGALAAHAMEARSEVLAAVSRAAHDVAGRYPLGTPHAPGLVEDLVRKAVAG